MELGECDRIGEGSKYNLLAEAKMLVMFHLHEEDFQKLSYMTECWRSPG